MFGVIAAVIVVATGFVVLGLFAYFLLKHLRPLKSIRDLSRIRPSKERHKLRLSIAMIRTNVLALVLIAVVALFSGAAQLGFDIWKYHFEEKAALSTAKLEELLQKRLPDPEIQQRQHRELVDAIQNRTSPDTILVPTDNEANKAEFVKLERVIATLERAAKERFANVEVLESFVILIFWSLAGVGVALFVRSFFATSTSRRVLEIVAAAALTVPSIFGGLKLANDLKTDITAIKEMGGIHFNFQWGKSEPPEPKPPEPKPPETKPPEPRDVEVYLHLDVGRGQDSPPALMDCGQGGERVGPFGIGAITLDAEETRKLAAFATSLKDLTNDKSNRLTAIALIGSADKRSLKPRTASLYSSNAGLARARIGVVRQALEGAFKPDKPPPIVETYAGPEKTDAQLSGDALSSDRSVKICLLWDRKS